MINPNDVAVDIELAYNLHDAVGDHAYRSAHGRPLIQAGVEMPTGFSVVQALHSERRRETARYRNFKRLHPITGGTHRIAQLSQSFQFSRGGF
jgi:hypothetical protein